MRIRLDRCPIGESKLLRWNRLFATLKQQYSQDILLRRLEQPVALNMSSNLLRTAFGHYPIIKNAYTRFKYYGIVRWVVDLAVLGFVIPILARNPGHDLLIASAYTVGVVWPLSTWPRFTL